MTQPDSYAYENRAGLQPVSWNMFHSLCKGLALAVSAYKPEIIIAVGRAGYYPGTLLAHMLQAELFPVRLSRRVNDVVKYKRPRWIVKPPKVIQDKRVLVVDEICDTGETLQKVAQRAEKLGATVRTAVLYAHSHGAHVPDYVGLISDSLILNPWDREIVQGEQFVVHPEYAGALSEQAIPITPDLLIDAPMIAPAKQPEAGN